MSSNKSRYRITFIVNKRIKYKNFKCTSYVNSYESVSKKLLIFAIAAHTSKNTSHNFSKIKTTKVAFFHVKNI